MEVSKLETFLVLAECLSFTEAAERLFCSQPSVSMQIQSLEKDLNTKLFDRLGKKTYLTKQGETVKPYAEQIINTVKAAKEHLHRSEDLSYGTLSFGASNFVGVYLLTKILTEFHQAYPNIKINMEVTTSKQLIHKLEVNAVELLVLSDQIVMDQRYFKSTSFFQDELVLVVPANHSFVRKKSIQFADLKDETILIKPEPSATRAFMEKKMKEFNFTFLKTMEISSSEGIKHGVIHGLGISFISRLAVSQEINNGLLVAIPMDQIKLSRNINYIHHKDKHLSPSVKKFIELLEKATTYDL